MSPTKSSRGVPKQINKNALLVAQEITFAKILSGNDPKIRERGIKRLQKWLTARSSSTCQFQENDLKRIWKGLFYCMWMSDKPLVQEEVAENISNLVHCFKNTKAFICFVKCFFLTMSVEWRGLDQWRMDKFLMFVRRFMRQVFMYCDQRSWSSTLVQELGVVFNCTVLPDRKVLSDIPHAPLGLSLHFVDIYMDELTKVSKGHLQNDELLVALLRPFALYMSESPEQSIATQIVSQIFDRLIEQSKEGHEFREKFEAWKQLGFPRGNINAVERVHTSDNEEEIAEDESEETAEDNEEEGDLDPRAGGVDVELPVASYNPEAVVKLLREYRHLKTSNSWSRKVVARVIARFNALVTGKYPLGIKKVEKIPKINFKKMAEQSAEELLEFRDKIMHEDDEEWIKRIQGEKNKKRKTKSGDYDDSEYDGDESGGDDEELEDEDDDDMEESEDDDVDIDEEEDLDDDADVDIDDDVDSADDEDEDDSEVEGDDDAEVKFDDGGDDDDTENDDDADDLENGDLQEDEEEEEEELESDESNEGNEVEVEEERAKLNVGKRKKTEQAVEEETPQKKISKNLPHVIPCGISKYKKHKQTVEEPPQKGTPENSPLVITNGISKKQKKQLEIENGKKEETVIIVGKKRKLSEALSTPLIHGGKQFKNVQHSPRTPRTPGSAKRVHFILQRNTAQAALEYDRILRENPGNPYDSAKRPRFGVLKSTPLASPVNPFYKP